MRKTPRYYQQDAYNALMQALREGKTPYANLVTGCHAPGYLIMMHDGSTKPVELIKVGDYVMGKDGQPRSVLSLHYGVDDMFKVTPVKGDAFVVNRGHIFHLYKTRSGRQYKSQEPKELDISVSDYLLSSNGFKHKAKLMYSPLSFHNNYDHIIDPWVLGFLIGDGCLCSITPSVSICHQDLEVKDIISTELDRLGVAMVKRSNTKKGCDDFYLSNNHVIKRTKNRLNTILVELGVNVSAAYKSIPKEYKFGNSNTQNNILSGLLDSDGHFSNNGYDWISKSEQLADDVVFIARCLGLSAYKKQCIKSCQNNFSSTYYRVSISGNTDILNIRTKRRRADKRAQIKNTLVTGFTIEPVGVGEYFGFEIDGDHLYLGHDFIIHHNSGKSLINAMFIDTALTNNKRILSLVPTKELCEQNYREAFNYVQRKADIGICCAKLGRYQVHKPAVIATASSFVSRRAHAGKFDILFGDECHQISPDEKGTYKKIIKSLRRINPAMKIVGVTATPYRTGQGMLHEDCIKGTAVFDHQAYESDISKLMEEGFLSYIKSISGSVEMDMTGVSTSGNDFNAQQMGVKFDQICADAVADMREQYQAYNISTSLIFASTLENARRILEEYNDPNTMKIVSGDMPDGQRKAVIKWFTEGRGARHIVNVGILTTGFDFPALQCVTFMRATKSLVLYKQIVGRVIRPHSEKLIGYVLDYGSNIERLGPIDRLIPPKSKKEVGDIPQKMCLLCQAPNILAAKKCKVCGAEFISEDETGNYTMKSKAEILADKAAAAIVDYEVDHLEYHVVYSKTDGTKMIKIDFVDENFKLLVSKYLCVEHKGRARDEAIRFLVKMFINLDSFTELSVAGINVDNVILLLESHSYLFKKINKITIDKSGRFTELKEMFFID